MCLNDQSLVEIKLNQIESKRSIKIKINLKIENYRIVTLVRMSLHRSVNQDCNLKAVNHAVPLLTIDTIPSTNNGDGTSYLNTSEM